jgi:hypothetical protein
MLVSNSPAADAGADGGPSQVKRVFVTHTGFPGDLKTAGAGATGLEGADNLCNGLARDAGLGGSWRAWLSSSTVSAIGRIADVGPWYTVDGKTLLFSDKANLQSLSRAPISQTELGEDLLALPLGSIRELVWTGSNIGGAPNGSHCADWTSAASDKAGNAGYWRYSTSWTEDGLLPTCDNPLALYCFEQ